MGGFIKRKKFLFLFIILFLGAFLRLYKVPAVPPGLYIDEISIAYNANEIIKNGADQYGAKFPLWFRAYGEYKMPVSVYLTAGSIAIFGRNDFVVRLPFVTSAILTLLIFYFLVKELAALAKKSLPFTPEALALISTLVLAISPWHIQFSRAGFEATIGLCFYLAGLLCAVIAYKKQKISFIILSFLFLVLTMYTYNIYRLMAPITALAVTSIFLKKQKQMVLKIVLSFLLFTIAAIPVIVFSLSGAGGERFAETSAFAPYVNLSLIQKIIQYPIIFAGNYASYFSLNFLFNIGDGMGRHQMPNFGPMQYWEFPFLIIGIYFFLKNWKNSFSRLILLLLLLAPFAGALTVPSPHTLRSFLLVIPFTIIVSYGFLWIIQKLAKGKLIPILIILIALISYEYLFYLHFYYQHYPIVNSIDWGAANKEVVLKAMSYKSNFQHFVVDGNLGEQRATPLYFGFYSNDTIKPLIVSSTWHKPDNWPTGSTLFIRPYYGEELNEHIIDAVYLPGINKDIYARFWRL